ncbi:MAG: ECF-type sigma factor [Gemmataceae bacterium]|nr:ECF-type sigma factor [Gemmataceae bacterium]
MSSSGSVSDWLAQLAQGDREAVAQLWRRYYPQLVRLALHRLQGAPALRDQAEDVALSAFDSFCRGAEQGRFPDLFDRDDLWQLLVVITARKAATLVRHEQRLQERHGVLSLREVVVGLLRAGPANRLEKSGLLPLMQGCGNLRIEIGIDDRALASRFAVAPGTTEAPAGRGPGASAR